MVVCMKPRTKGVKMKNMCVRKLFKKINFCTDDIRFPVHLAWHII